MNLKKFLRSLSPNTVYIQVRTNEFTVKHIESGLIVRKAADAPFTTHRLLIANIDHAQSCLRDCLNEVAGLASRLVKPDAIIHPLEMVEGGLSQVEQRVYGEVVYRAGAAPTPVWVGHELSDDEAIEWVHRAASND